MCQETFSQFCVTGMLFLFTLFQSLPDAVSGGNCWATKVNGKCSDLRRSNVTRAECCALSGITYWSEEELNNGQIFYYVHLIGGYDKMCSPCTDTCSNVACPNGKRCKVKNGAPRCVCAPNCSVNSIGQRGPVCGTNLRSYRSHCSLLRYNCRHENHVEVSYYGLCQVGSCDQVQCARPGTNCVMDQNSLPHCIQCITDCAPNRNPAQMVCGADGITYESACHAMSTACREGREIPVAYRGPCVASATCSNIQCRTGTTCLMNPATSRPRCVDCNPLCPRGRRAAHIPKLCGTDNVTYDNWCALRRASCRAGLIIETRHVGTCDQPLRDQAVHDSSEA